MSKCSYCAATLTYVVEHWDRERGGAWWAYDTEKKHWCGITDEFVGFTTNDLAFAFFVEYLKKFPHERVRLREIAHGERIVHQYDK